MKRKTKKNLAFALIAAMLLLVACGGGNVESAAQQLPEPTEPQVLQPAVQETPEPVEPAESIEPTRPTTDREGYPITLPYEINTILSIGPSNTEILVALGLADNIVAVDMFSADVEGLPPGISTALSIVGLDAEYVINLMPDVIFVTGMARMGGEDDPLAPVSEMGISVIFMPTSTSIAAIIEDIQFMAAVVDATDAGETIVANMQSEIEEIRQIAETITEPRTVYFEVAPMITFGTGTFLHEMIELVGAINIFADQDGWASVTGEAVLEANPDVILTSADFLEDPIADITERPGFGVITAVQNGDVFQIDTATSSRANHNIVTALWQIGQTVFPSYFQ
ncbi:MAG: ABC transporter substrate-binding protein [Defluviitaleaceae bacterium]|nr:ABC transporter substrate-binding protein [Defluviitaleaceae bacterium]